MKYGLTTNMQKMLDYIREYKIRNNGRSPSYEDLRSMAGYSSRNSAYYMVKELEKRGYIQTLDRKRRTITIIE